MACIPGRKTRSKSNRETFFASHNSSLADLEDFKGLPYPNRVPNYVAIEKSPAHKLTLEDWKYQLDASSKNLVWKLSSRNSCTSDLYQILALFFVFQGVVITAIAQASALKCHNWYLVLLLSAISFFATLGACIHKLKEITEANKLYLEEKAVCTSLFTSIVKLKEGVKEGDSGFDLQKHQPILGQIYTDREDQSRGSVSGKVRAIGLFKTWVWSYSGAVLFILISFSAVTLVAIRLIVCDPHRN